MNVLIITTYFPPDTAIAAVRPFMFAKYLRQAGHQVTVLRSGEILNSYDDGLSWKEQGIRVCSYLGENSAAERYERGETPPRVNPKRKMRNLPETLRRPLAWAFRRYKTVKKVLDTRKKVALQKAWIDEHREDRYDVVFATYGNLENVYAGEYAAKVFGCKWILDLRDTIAPRSAYTYPEYLYFRHIQKKKVQQCDVCTVVSSGLADLVTVGTDKKAEVLYNGFDASVDEEEFECSDRILRIVYTGIMYDKRSAAPLFAAVKKLNDQGRIDQKNIRFEYAGPHFEMLRNQAKPYGVEDILVDHDVLTRQEAAALQKESDIFLVLTWNTAYERGILTGKFYEGIRARKPILALVSGEVPDSELMLLNRTYNYGLCYEECAQEAAFEELCAWLERAYAEKSQGRCVPYAPDEKLFSGFRYDHLTGQLESILKELANN